MSLIMGGRLLERVGEASAIRVLRESVSIRLLMISWDFMNLRVIRIARASVVKIDTILDTWNFRFSERERDNR